MSSPRARPTPPIIAPLALSLGLSCWACLDVPAPLPPLAPAAVDVDAAPDGFADDAEPDPVVEPDAAVAAPELCNGDDDDLDGLVDEAIADEETDCAARIRRCVAGAWVLVGDGYEADEVSCDGRDNDCDGLIDEGHPVACAFCGGPGDTAPPCNGCPARIVVPADAVCVPPGAFVIGSPPRQPDPAPGAVPAHDVTLTRPILVQRTELTKATLDALGLADPSLFTADGQCAAPDCPVERISLLDARWLANAASTAQGLAACYPVDDCQGDPLGGCGEGAPTCDGGYLCPESNGDDARAGALLDCDGWRLPTEAEWEYFARAGTITRYWSGDGSGALRDVSWVIVNAGGHPHPVGPVDHIREANPWGLWNIHGNVAEWTNDGYAPYTAEAITDPRTRLATVGVVRGGHWDADADDSRSAARHEAAIDHRSSKVGLRLVRTVEPLPEP